MKSANYDKMHKKLKKNVGEKRYRHSLGVEKTARELSLRYDYDEEKAALAGLMHDCGKLKDSELILKLANEFGIIQDDIMISNPALVHGPLGSVLAREVYGIHDEEILEAISCHTTGKVDMNLLDKIIYVSDYIEPNRSFEGLDEIRRIAFNDIDKALLITLNNTIKYVLDRGQLLHLDTVKARNYLIKICQNRR